MQVFKADFGNQESLRAVEIKRLQDLQAGVE